MRDRVVGYIRAENEDADQFLAGKQIDVISEWAAENGADILDWYFDIGVAEAEPFQRRSAGIQLLDRVSRGDVTHVVVSSLDVLGKGRALLGAVQLLFEAKNKLSVITVLPGPHGATERDEKEDEVGAYRRRRAEGPRALKAA